jgi:hypothetical protein
MRSNRSIPASTVVPVLVPPDVRAAGVRVGEDVAPGDWGGIAVAG